jgi:serine/threonine protein kinase
LPTNNLTEDDRIKWFDLYTKRKHPTDTIIQEVIHSPKISNPLKNPHTQSISVCQTKSQKVTQTPKLHLQKRILDESADLNPSDLTRMQYSPWQKCGCPPPTFLSLQNSHPSRSEKVSPTKSGIKMAPMAKSFMNALPAGYHIGDYELGEELGEGAFARVFKGTHTKTQQNYAVKVVEKSRISTDAERDRFQREINAMAYLKHPNVVTLRDFLWDEERYFLIMDYCPGGTLFEYIVSKEKIDEPMAALILEQMIAALAYCHSYGVAHRDLKPENVMIDKFPLVKVADFGLCGFMGSDLMKTFCGSPCYCAPECVCRIQYDGRKSDVWSLGVVLYAAVTGNHPWNTQNVSKMLRQITKGAYIIPTAVSPQCRELIAAMLKVEPLHRLTLEQILAHPWMKLAEKVRNRMPVKVQKLDIPLIPNSVSLEEISQESAQSARKSVGGIFSPFDNDDQNSGPMPALVTRSLSSRDLTKRFDPADVKNITCGSGRGQMNERTRAGTFSAKIPKGKSKAMVPIKEDD